MENSYYKVIATCDRSLLKSVPGITKCDRSLLQCASGITKCGRLLLQSVSGITKCDRLLLQSASVITKCGNYYKVRRSNYKQQTSLLIKFNKVSYTFCQLRKFNCVTFITKRLKSFLK